VLGGPVLSEPIEVSLSQDNKSKEERKGKAGPRPHRQAPEVTESVTFRIEYRGTLAEIYFAD
jgi:hypothetical protein